MRWSRSASYRSKRTGRFVSEEYAHKHPEATQPTRRGPGQLVMLGLIGTGAAVALIATLVARSRR
jgi:hypothetical protein